MTNDVRIELGWAEIAAVVAWKCAVFTSADTARRSAECWWTRFSGTGAGFSRAADGVAAVARDVRPFSLTVLSAACLPSVISSLSFTYTTIRDCAEASHEL